MRCQTTKKLRWFDYLCNKSYLSRQLLQSPRLIFETYFHGGDSAPDYRRSEKLPIFINVWKQFGLIPGSHIYLSFRGATPSKPFFLRVRRALVLTFRRTFWPSTTNVLVWRLGFQTLLVWRCEKLTLLPNCLPLPVSSHFCIRFLKIPII